MSREARHRPAVRDRRRERGYAVVVRNAGTGLEDTVRVSATDDWMAATRAQMGTGLSFRGEVAEYYELLPGGGRRRMCQHDSPGAIPGEGWNR